MLTELVNVICGVVMKIRKFVTQEQKKIGHLLEVSIF